MALFLKYLYGVQSNIMFKYMTKGYIPVLYAKVQDCKSNLRIISRAFNTSSTIPEGVMESCDISNGMHLICECKNSYTTTVGCFLPAGSMHEMPEERGSALFLEHLLFRRTVQRSQKQIEEAIEEIGGRINTIAMRDMFLFYGTVPSCNIERLIELFADVILDGIICNEDVLNEKCIILNDLVSIESDEEKVVMDYLTNVAYQNTTLANGVYPETAVIKSFCAESLISFRKRLFQTCYVTMISTGSISLQELQQIVSKYFINENEETELLPECCKTKAVDPHKYRFSGAELRLRDDDEELGYVALGLEGPGCTEHQDHFAFTVAKEIMGSWDMTYGGANHNAPYLAHCAFNTGICQMYKSFFLNWAQTTSIWGCYFVCQKLDLEGMLSILQTEWMRLCTTVTQKEVSRAVNQCKITELMKLHDPIDRFLDIVKSLFRYGYYEPMQQRLLEYEKVTADSIRQVTRKYIYDQSPAVVAVGRIENLPDYYRIRSGTYLLKY